MKFPSFKLLSLLLLLFLAPNLKAADETGEYSKEYNRSFPLAADGAIELANKYGRINVRTWDKNEVKIDVKIVVQARDEDEANEVFERIRINFYDTKELVKAYTEIGTNKNKSGWWDWISGGGNNSREFKIYYEVAMPAQANLMTQARYCDVRCTDLDGPTEFDVKYGDLVTGDLGQETEVTVGYGSAEIGKVSGKAKLQVSYSELELESAERIDLRARYSEIEISSGGNTTVDTRYSEIKLGDMGDVDVDAGYGDVDVSSANSIKAESNYTSYDVGKVKDMVDIDTDYGDVKVGPLATGFSMVRVRGGYASIDIKVDSKAGYDLSVSTSYAGVDYPEGIDLSRKEKSGNSKKIVGKKSGLGTGKIDITSRYGSVDIREY